MRWFLPIALAILPAFLFAQDFNGDFENWETDTAKFPESWLVSGHVMPSESHFEGNGAVKMLNQSDGSFGFISTTPDVQNFSGGHAYNERPLSLKFRAKYDLSPGDAGVVAAIFKYKGTPIATATVYVQGSSMDTFTAFSVPLVWQQSILPDSVVLLASSANLLDNEAPTGEGYMILDDLQFTSINTVHSPPPNAGFELWRNHYRYFPTHWVTADQVFMEDAGPALPYTLVERIQGARLGDHAVLIQNATIPGSRNAIPGFIITGKGTDVEEMIEKPAFPVNLAWNFLNGWYKFHRGGNDSAFVYCLMFKEGQPIGLASFNNFQPSDEWQVFNIPISYFGNIVPDSASIFIGCANPEKAESGETRLVLDDMQFTETILAHAGRTIETAVFKLYPNPCRDVIHLSESDLWERYHITDAQGKLVKEGNLLSDTLLIANLENGHYVLTLSNHVNHQRIKFIKL